MIITITKEQAKERFSSYVLATFKSRSKVPSQAIPSACGALIEEDFHFTEFAKSLPIIHTAKGSNESDTVDGELYSFINSQKIPQDFLGYYDCKCATIIAAQTASHTCSARELIRWLDEINTGKLIFIFSFCIACTPENAKELQTLRSVDELLEFVSQGKMRYEVRGIFDFADIHSSGVLKNSQFDDGKYFNLVEVNKFLIPFSDFISATNGI